MYSQYNSSAGAELQSCITASKGNPLTIANLSELLIVDGIPVYSPNSVIEDYMGYIMENLIDIALPDELQFRPESLSESLYGTPDLWYLLMLINGKSSVTDFYGPSVKALSPTSSIIELISAARMKGLNAQRANPYVVQDLTIREII
jgi:hypothetical protein